MRIKAYGLLADKFRRVRIRSLNFVNGYQPLAYLFRSADLPGWNKKARMIEAKINMTCRVQKWFPAPQVRVWILANSARSPHLKLHYRLIQYHQAVWVARRIVTSRQNMPKATGLLVKPARTWLPRTHCGSLLWCRCASRCPLHFRHATQPTKCYHFSVYM